MKDIFGREWNVSAEESCPTCGQPDNCGDCDHTQLSAQDYELLNGEDRMKVGDRIELVDMPDDPDPVPVGSLGTITNIVNLDFGPDKELQVSVDWDSGRTISLILPHDKVRVIHE